MSSRGAEAQDEDNRYGQCLGLAITQPSQKAIDVRWRGLLVQAFYSSSVVLDGERHGSASSATSDFLALLRQ